MVGDGLLQSTAFRAIAPELVQRLRNYAFDEPARLLLQSLRPVVEPQLERAID
jgi:hypothetical protein